MALKFTNGVSIPRIVRGNQTIITNWIQTFLDRVQLKDAIVWLFEKRLKSRVVRKFFAEFIEALISTSNIIK